MAFATRNFSVLAYANGFTLWHYKAARDEAKTVASPGYFEPAADMLNAGDIVLVSSPAGGRMLCVAPSKAGIHTVPLSR